MWRNCDSAEALLFGNGPFSGEPAAIGIISGNDFQPEQIIKGFISRTTHDFILLHLQHAYRGEENRFI